MKTWIMALAATLMLSGCVSTHTREVVYREPYHQPHQGGYGQHVPQASYRERYVPQSQYQGGGTYYTPAWRGSGDYYHGGGYSYSYIDYPVYYSMFWPINRWYYDPFYYPDYYYGVTWYPQSYFSFGLGWSRPWGHYGLSYSPYRYAWVDNYYDWYPWYSRYPRYRRHYPTPRYGDARVEARRLADLRPPVHDRPYVDQRGRGHLQAPELPIAPAYHGNRAADYGARGPASRMSPNVGAFGNPASSRMPVQAGGTRGQLQALSRHGVQDASPQDGRWDARRQGTSVRDVRGIPVPRQSMELRGSSAERRRLAQPLQDGAGYSPGLQAPRVQTLGPAIRSEPLRGNAPALHELRGATRVGSSRHADMPRPMVRQGGMMQPQMAPPMSPSRRAYSTGAAPMPQMPRAVAPAPSVRSEAPRSMPRMEPRPMPSPAAPPRSSSSRSELRAIHEN